MDKHEQHLGERDEVFFRTIGYTHPYNRPKSQWCKKPENDKILTLADPHEPYASDDVKQTVEREHKDAKMVYVAGDVGDYYSKSRFKKTRVQSFREEMRSVFMFLEWLATHWADVRIQIGNHDDRPEKAIQEALQANVDLMIMTEHNLLAYMASFFDNIEIVGTPVNLKDCDGTRIKKNLTHLYQLGDIIFTHGERSATQSTALMGTISLQLFRWKGYLGLKPYRIIAQAHNHANLKTPMGDEWWFQLPTASEPFSVGSEYILSSRMQGNPPAIGYSVFYQSNGETDVARSHNFPVTTRRY